MCSSPGWENVAKQYVFLQYMHWDGKGKAAQPSAWSGLQVFAYTLARGN
jgi:hypothetical protein